MLNRNSELHKAIDEGKQLLYMNKRVGKDKRYYYSHADALADAIEKVRSKSVTSAIEETVPTQQVTKDSDTSALEALKHIANTKMTKGSKRIGEEISSKGSELGKKLTNVNYAKDGKSAYDIKPHDTTLVDPKTVNVPEDDQHV